jgi:glycosyltransferase involved in cell wall biosynthesis
MIMKNSISFIIPCLNEEKQLLKTYETIIHSLKGESWEEYEIIIVNDGSSDKTKNIASELLEKNKNVSLINHQSPQGKGHSTNKGFRAAKNDYLLCVNGKNDTAPEQLKKIYNARHLADVVISTQNNCHDRPLIRQVFSRSYTLILNILFNLRLAYYNGSILIPKDAFRKIKVKTNSYAFETEMLLKILQLNYSYTQIGVRDTFEKNRATRSFSVKNISGVIYTVARLFITIRLMPLFRSKNYSLTPE